MSRVTKTIKDDLYQSKSLVTRIRKRKNAVDKHISYSTDAIKFKKCQCSLYVPEKGEFCGCGDPKEAHPDLAIQNYYEALDQEDLPKKWDFNLHTIDIDSEDYGLINFADSKGFLSKFARVSHRTKAEELTNLLSHWISRRPQLVISITGSADGFDFNKKLEELLYSGLVKTALTTNAWIVTGGTNVGIMKGVGRAVRENVSALDPKKQIVLLGIANWMTIRNRHLLEKEYKQQQKSDKDSDIFDPNDTTDNNNDIHEYSTRSDITNLIKTGSTRVEKNVPLDPNHSHFILVDNQKLNTFGGEIELRAKLEHAIANNIKTKEKIPIVSLVLGGGPNTFSLILQSVNAGTPCLFIEDSGRCAQVFVHIYRMIKNQSIDIADLRQEILDQLKINVANKEDMHENMADIVQEVFKSTHLLTTYQLNSFGNYDIDEAILYAILKSQKMNEEEKPKRGQKEAKQTLVQTQLNLALAWNRIDTAKKYVLLDKTWASSYFEKLMYKAIDMDRVDFVEAFIEHGLVLSKFVTYRVMLKLYNEDSLKQKAFHSCLTRDKRLKEYSLIGYIRRKLARDPRENQFDVIYGLKDVGRVINKLIDGFYRHRYYSWPFNQISNEKYKKILKQTDNYGKCNRLTSSLYLNIPEIDFEAYAPIPENLLFMYCVLTKKTEMAKLFIKEGRAEISSALIASKIYKSYAKIFDQESEEYLELANNFENLAYEIIDKAYQRDNNRAKLLLMREIPEFGYSTCLQIASLANNQKFLGHRCIQELLMTLWFGKLSTETSYMKITISVFIPFLAPVLCTFKELKTEDSNKDSEDMNEEGNEDMNSQASKKQDQEDMENDKTKNRINIKDDLKKFNYFEKLYYFFNAPIVKFGYDKISYLLFLLLFSYVLLCDFFPYNKNFSQTTTFNTNLSLSELCLIVWAGCFMIQKAFALHATEPKRIGTKISIFFRNFWNLMEFIASIGFIIGIILRFIPDNYNCYLASRIILSLDIIIWFFQMLHAYSVVRYLGPKLFMIMKMSFELGAFIFIMAVFFFAFGVSTQSLLYHNMPLDRNLIKNVFFPAYFVIGGEYYTAESILTASTCEVKDKNRDQTDVYSRDDCPDRVGADVTLFIYTFYMIFLNILLTNLLIAIFSKTYDTIEEESDNVWKSQRYKIVYEYFHKPTLPPPFVVIKFLSFPITLITKLLKSLCFKNLRPSQNIFNKIFYHFYQEYKNGFKIYFENSAQKKAFVTWESQIAEEVVNNEKLQKFENIEYKLQSNYVKYSKLSRDLRTILDKRVKTEMDLVKIDNMLDQILTQIEKDPNNKNKEAIKEIIKKILKTHLN